MHRYPASLLLIEEEFIKKPMQTIVVDFWGKMAAHMQCVADKLIEGGQGQNCGGMFVYYIFYYKSIGFPSNVLQHSSK